MSRQQKLCVCVWRGESLDQFFRQFFFRFVVPSSEDKCNKTAGDFQPYRKYISYDYFKFV